MTEDLDVFVEVSALNAKRLRSVLVDFPLRLSVGTINVISRGDLIRNKRASGRAKDLADLVALRTRPTSGK